MNSKELTSRLAEIHNVISDIAVSGEDVLRMATAISALRNLVQIISTDGVDCTEGENNEQ